MGEPIWLSRTQVQARLADTYRAGRVFVAGDAAHLFPAGGAGLNIGLMDAVNLGWKLAADLHGWAPAGLVDSYHTERHLAGTRALLQTRAQRALGKAAGEDGKALRALFGELVGYPEPLRHVGEMLAGADTRYDMTTSDQNQGSDPGPLLGRVVPDLLLRTTTGATRTTELMRSARGILLDFTGQPTLTKTAAPWADRVDVVTAETTVQNAPSAVLVRPDGYVAWTATSDATTDGLTHPTPLVRRTSTYNRLHRPAVNRLTGEPDLINGCSTRCSGVTLMSCRLHGAGMTASLDRGLGDEHLRGMARLYRYHLVDSFELVAQQQQLSAVLSAEST